jgi:membrane-associated protease RseP (regulator of RpoE activity)
VKGPVPGEKEPRQRAGSSQWPALARLSGVVLAGIVAAVVLHATDLLIVVVSLVAMVMLHEAGHLAMAKWGRMKVTEYFLGFGPKVWSVRFGETEYGVKAIPAGGYVRIAGMTNLEEVPAADEPRTYRQAPFWRRISVAVAGSVVHFLIALVLMWAVFAVVGVPSGNQVSVAALSRFTGTASPAQRAGLQPGDIIVSVDGHHYTGDSLASFIQHHAGDRLTMVVHRGGRNVALHITPVPADSVRYASTGSPEAAVPTGSEGVIGVTLAAPRVRSNPAAAVAQGAQQTWRLATTSVMGLVHFFSPHGITHYVTQVSGASPAPARASRGPSQAQGGSGGGRLLSILGAARLATQAANAGLFNVLLIILADINVFVGIFNMIPLLPLDGGHVAVAIYERLRSRKDRRYMADLAKMLPVTYAVFLILVVIGAGTLYFDIVHPAPNPFH